MKNALYILILLITTACADITPEIKPVDNTPVASDKIYLPGGQNYNSVKVTSDGTIWARAEGCYYSLKDNELIKYPNTGSNTNDFGIYKSGIYYKNETSWDNPLFVTIDNGSLNNYISPYKSDAYYYYKTYIELDSIMCIASSSDYNDPLQTLHFFNEKDWSSHSMKSISNDFFSIFKSNRYNYIFKSNLRSDLVVYDAIHDKEVEFNYNFELRDEYWGTSTPLDVTFSPNGIDKNGNIYGVVNNTSYVVFNFESGLYSSKTFSIPSIEYPYFIEIFVDDNNDIWYFGYDNQNSYNYFAFNINTNILVKFDDVYSDYFNQRSFYIDKKQIFWITISENSYTNIWAYQNGNLIENIALNADIQAFEKDDNEGNFWFGVWSQYGNYELEMFCYKNGEFETFKKYFVYNSNGDNNYSSGF